MKVKKTVTYDRCTVYCSWQDMVCPLCGVTVPAKTEHHCAKESK